eukprot:SAG31_NODE_3722_length_3949_cov_7.490130_5_plen_114_part_00
MAAKLYLSCLLEGEQAASTSVAVYSTDRLRTGLHAMVRRIDAAAAAAQLQLTARPTCQKWSPELDCRPITDCGAAPLARSAQQVGSSWWPWAVGGAEVGALMGGRPRQSRPGG